MLHSGKSRPFSAGGHSAPTWTTLPPQARARTVTAVLGPTNTGKTHLAIERMIARETGIIGLPLRLLAREVYGRITERVGTDKVALVTGEEKIIPPDTRYWVSTVEAMPLDLVVDFVAIDEVQLAGDLERGHVFTDRILNMRGTLETLLLGSATARPLLERLLPGLNVVTRPRMSILAYSGQKKITRLPARSAVVAFSSSEVYAIAELIRRQHGGAAVVLGSLSPRTRNAQVELFQNYGFSDYLRWLADDEAPTSPTRYIRKQQLDYLTDAAGTLAVQRILRQERLADDLAKMAAELDLAVTVPERRANPSSHGHYREYYDDFGIDLIARRHKDDVETFGYTF
jgi:hypothetical protein